MADFLELRNFNIGTIRKGDESDLPNEAATFSLNVDTVSEAGVLQGRKSDAIITVAGPANTGTSVNHSIDISTSKGKFYGILNDASTYHFIYYSNGVIKSLLNIFNNEGSASSADISELTLTSGSYLDKDGAYQAGTANSGLVNSSHIATMEEYNKALHIGMDDGVSKWAGIVKHEQFGHYQTNTGSKDGTYNPILQDSELKPPNLFTEFQWVVHSNNGFVYGAEWEGKYVHRFEYNASADTYTYHGKSSKKFKNIHGIAARHIRSGDGAITEGGVWVYDAGVGSYGKLFEYFKDGSNSVTNTHNISNIYYDGTTTDTYWDNDLVGGICESYHSTAGEGRIYFSKWVKQKSIVDETEEDINDNLNTTGHYKQKSFLWKTDNKIGSYSTDANITLVNSTPHLMSDLATSRTAGFTGYENVYYTNPNYTGSSNSTGVGIGGAGMLQGGEKGVDFTSMNDGVRTAKIAGAQDGTNNILTDDGTDSHVTPVYRYLKVDPWPSTPWHSMGMSDGGLKSPDTVLTASEYEEGLGLLFAFYDNHDGTANVRAGCAMYGYHKGKGYWTDSDKEHEGYKGKSTNQLGRIDTDLSHRSGLKPAELRGTGALMTFLNSGTTYRTGAAVLNNGDPGIKSDYNAEEDESKVGFGLLDTYHKLVFFATGFHLYSYRYNNAGQLEHKDTFDAAPSPADLYDYSGNGWILSPGSTGQNIDCINKVIIVGTYNYPAVNILTYTEEGEYGNVGARKELWTTGYLGGGKFTESANQHVIDIVVDPSNKEAYMMLVGDSTEGFIMQANYSTGAGGWGGGSTEFDANWALLGSVTKHQSGDNSTVDGNFKTLAEEGAHGWIPSAVVNNLGTLGIDTNLRILFWTKADGTSIGSCTIGTGGNNNCPDYRTVNTIIIGGAGSSIGFKVDMVNRVLYGYCKALGMYTIKYDSKGRMTSLSNIDEFHYGATDRYGSTSANSGTAVNATSTDWGKMDEEATAGTDYDGGRACQIAMINEYQANNQQDDSHSTSAIMFSALTLDTTGDSRGSILIGAGYNYLPHYIEVPKNALYISDQSGYQPLAIRVNGYGFDHSGYPTYTLTNSTASDTNSSSGCFGNFCSFSNNAGTGNNLSTTWGVLHISDTANTNSTYKTIYDDLSNPFQASKLAYFALRDELDSASDTDMKDRSKHVWATPHSLALITDDGDTASSKQLVVSCGNAGISDVTSILAYTPPTIAITEQNTANSGIVSIPYSDLNNALVEVTPSARVVDTPYTKTANYGRINIFNGETGGDWYSIELGDAGASMSNTFVDRFLELAKLKIEPNLEGSGYKIDTVGDVFYKMSFLYDGYQESPLSSDTVYHLRESADLDLTLIIGSMINLRQDYARVTHIKIYRATNFKHDDSNPQPIGHYRFIKQFKLEGKDFTPVVGDNESWEAEFTDSNKASYSYESATGISEVFTDTSLKYSISCQINNFHIVGKAKSTLDPDINDTMIFKSRAYNYDQFNILSDRLMLPFTPTVLASYQGRIWAFDKSRVCKIEPNQFYIEDTYISSGCVDPKALVVTEYGMFYADDSNIYMHNGQKSTPISQPIDFGTYGWTNRDKSITPVMVWDSNDKKVLVYFGVKDYISSNTELENASDSTNIYTYAWVYTILEKRWDLIKNTNSAQGKYVSGGITSPYGLPYVFSDNTDDILKIGGNTSTRESWWWHSKEHDFGGRVLNKKLNNILVSGLETSGNITDNIGESETNAHPYVASTQNWLLEVDNTNKEGTSLYTSRTNTTIKGKFKIKSPNNTGHVFKLKLNKMNSTKKIQAIGLTYRVKGYR